MFVVWNRLPGAAFHDVDKSAALFFTVLAKR